MAAERETLPALSRLCLWPSPCAQLLGASAVSLMLEKHFGSRAERDQERQGVIVLFFSHLQCRKATRGGQSLPHRGWEAAVNGGTRGLAEAERGGRWRERHAFSWSLLVSPLLGLRPIMFRRHQLFRVHSDQTYLCTFSYQNMAFPAPGYSGVGMSKGHVCVPSGWEFPPK